MNSCLRVVKRGVHQALDLGEGGEPGMEPLIIVLNVVREDEKHWSGWLGEGVFGGGGLPIPGVGSRGMVLQSCLLRVILAAGNR